jgi:hypothetical protein
LSNSWCFRISTVAIEGPYGYLRPLRQFDSIVLLAGSTGVTFTVPLLRDALRGWEENARPNSKTHHDSFFGKQSGSAIRSVRFVWVVKSKGQLGWFSEQLSSIYADFQNLQGQLRNIKLEMTVYVTCDDTFTEEHKSLLSTITAPISNNALRKDPEHGTVEYRKRFQATGQDDKIRKDESSVRELSSADSQLSEVQIESCGQNGTCCCRTDVDEKLHSGGKAICCCSSNPNASRPTSQVSSTLPSSEEHNLLVHPSITVISGRPKTRDIIRRSLEQALGESAIVVCGPQGLVADVKQDVCSLSDERAVHKGTGAQGIYLHTESFGY